MHNLIFLYYKYHLGQLYRHSDTHTRELRRQISKHVRHSHDVHITALAHVEILRQWQYNIASPLYLCRFSIQLPVVLL